MSKNNCVICDVHGILSKLNELRKDFRECLNESNLKIDSQVKMYIGAFHESLKNSHMGMLNAQEEILKSYLSPIKNANRVPKKANKKATLKKNKKGK